MGNLTVKESGEMVNIISPNVSKITSFKVHFSPRQEGSGDPSPDNVREITGWNGVEIGLPDEYQEVEYIENTDQAFIMTNFWSGEVGSVDIDFYYVSYRQWANLLGTSDKTSDPYGSCLLLTHSNKFRMSAYGRVNNIETDPLTIGNRYKINAVFKSGNQSLTINNKLIGTNNYVWETSVPYMSLFGIYYGTQYSKPLERALVRIYSCTFYNNNEKIIEHFVPCYRKSDNEIGMYGTITKTFYTNAGTGTFLKGANVNKIQTSIDWTEDVGTVYGGYVDLISGELVQTWQLRQISELSVVKTSGTGTWEHRFDMKHWITGVGYETSRTPFKCLIDCFTLGLADHNYSFLTYVKNVSVYDDTISTADEFKAKYGQNYVAYEIIPDLWQTYQLTPQQLSTLKGQNNFWSNADYVEIEYELTETFDIQKTKRKIILNQPHIESASGDLVTFDTDMKGKLKECKVYFSPVQEGSGDPSPDNVRNIVGWNGVKSYCCGKNLFQHENGAKSILNLKKGTTITISQSAESNLGYFRGYDINNNTVTGIIWINEGIENNRRYKNYTLIDDIYYGVIYVGTGIQEAQVTIDGTINYEPYQSNIINIDWTDDVGTVYGGYVDLVSGELTATYVVETFTTTGKTSMDKNHDTTEDSIYFYLAPSYPFISLGYGITEVSGNSVHAGPKNGKSNQLRIIYGDNWRGTSLVNTLGSNYQLNSFSIRMQKDIFNLSNEYTEEEKATAINNYLTEHPLQVGYTLKTPITYQLTPQTLHAFKGTNNIYSNTNGQTEIKYWKH